ncbi:F-box/WD repeat-containing protein 4-like [Gigantopelta aegis]|uniref:F-box/WD repeat-containing protein 4-like n=1 Tax=Gigantopelta aegis TaxID=1735272 RepID=UPI001B88DCDF|nr:F-box/WD repeat-containing protein 4-like [Gigantopelta aegis]
MNLNMPVDGKMNKQEKSDVYMLVADNHNHDNDKRRQSGVCDYRRKTSRKRLTLIYLPDDVLLLIYSYLDVQSLGRLCQACSRFRNLTSLDTVWLPHSKNVFIIRDLNRNGQSLSLKEQCRVAKNWNKKKSHEVTLLRNSSRLMPWMQYEKQTIWISTQNVIRCFRLKQNGYLAENSQHRLEGFRDDVSRFVIKKDLLVAGCRDGSIGGWSTSTGSMLFHFLKVHTGDTQCVDLLGDLLISGSRDCHVKITSLSCNNSFSKPRKTLQIHDRVWSLGVSPDGTVLAVGSAGCGGIPPLAIWDLNSCEMALQLGTNHKRGAGVLDMTFTSPNTLLTCGYDSYLRLWDVRTASCVAEWEEPYDTALYCVQTDDQYAVMTGTARYGMTRLWDMRQSQPIQVYYSGRRSSPVYALAFNSCRFYVALDVSINMIDFTGFK